MGKPAFLGERQGSGDSGLANEAPEQQTDAQSQQEQVADMDAIEKLLKDRHSEKFTLGDIITIGALWDKRAEASQAVELLVKHGRINEFKDETGTYYNYRPDEDRQPLRRLIRTYIDDNGRRTTSQIFDSVISVYHGIADMDDLKRVLDVMCDDNIIMVSSVNLSGPNYQLFTTAFEPGDFRWRDQDKELDDSEMSEDAEDQPNSQVKQGEVAEAILKLFESQATKMNASEVHDSISDRIDCSAGEVEESLMHLYLVAEMEYGIETVNLGGNEIEVITWSRNLQRLEDVEPEQEDEDNRAIPLRGYLVDTIDIHLHELFNGSPSLSSTLVGSKSEMDRYVSGEYITNPLVKTATYSFRLSIMAQHEETGEYSMFSFTTNTIDRLKSWANGLRWLRSNNPSPTQGPSSDGSE